MILSEAIKILEENGYCIELNEDFGMGVADIGADQGIPHGGDCKAVVPCRMGHLQRRPLPPPGLFTTFYLKRRKRKKKSSKRR